MARNANGGLFRTSTALIFVASCSVIVKNINCSVAYNWVSNTLSGTPCLNTCTNGKCYVDHHLNEEACRQDRGAGVPHYHTALYKGNAPHCLSNCARFGGYNYEWCYTSENYDWDYCNSAVKSNYNSRGRTIYGAECIDDCAIYYYTPSKCHTVNQNYVACAIPAVMPVQSCSNLFRDTAGIIKRSPVLDRIFSPNICTNLCRLRIRDGYDGEVEQRINNALAPGTYSGIVTTNTIFPPGSPYTFVATTNSLNSLGENVLMPLVVRATLRRPPAAPRVSEDVPRIAALNVYRMYDNLSTNIDTGHIVAFVNGGTRDLFNFVGQTVAVNRGPYKVIENYIKEWIHSYGYAELTVVIDYVGTRPSEFGVKVKLFNDDGSLHSDCLDIIIANF